MIPKPDGRQRPLGIAALEDKILQHAVGTVLNQIWEEDFLGFSYGFRPGRSQHDALDALYVGIMRQKVSWVLDLDIRAFFDTIDHAWMVPLVAHRIGDRRIVRLLQKWLRAGVLELRTVERDGAGDPTRGSDFANSGESIPALWCARTNLALPAGEIPAPTRGAAALPGIESWV
jgi:RNA-directed DNA polymerase